MILRACWAPHAPIRGMRYAKLYTCGKQLQYDRGHKLSTGAPDQPYSYLSASAGKIRAADHDG